MREVTNIRFKDGEISEITIAQPNTAPSSQTYSTGEYPLSFLNLMQYTGLKDKNGVEIYEGDVIEYEEMEVETGGYYTETITVEYVAPMFSANEEGEVIGNIYQNPELIK
jgi:uncharacterized phage protein (TIGR01671 family)